MKYKKILITFLIIILFYLFLIFKADKIQTLSTFPGIKANLQDLVGYKKALINFEEINIKSKRGENINGLYLTGSKNEVVYYFHGNGGPLPYFYSEIKYINDLGYGVFAYDYPGYGKSTGFPDKKLVLEFSQDFFEYIKKEKNIKNENLIIWGYSVGTAVGTDFASKNEFSKIILIAPFSSRYDMGKRWFFGIPLQKILFLEDSYKTSELVKNFKKPALIIHGNFDMIVSFWQGKKVFENYGGEKYFIEIDKNGHNGIIDDFGFVFKNIFLDFISGKKLDFDYLFIDGKKKKELEEKNKEVIFSGEILKSEDSLSGKLLKEDKIILDIESQKDFKNLDFKTDNSITKYVSANISYNKVDYKPNDLEYIAGDFVIDVKLNQTLRKIARENLDKLSRDFYNDLGVKLKIVSAYRSYNYQVGIKSRGCSDIFCAKAGYSEHQSGLAFDIFETTTGEEFLSKHQKYFDWMQKNAYKYGFTNSYRKGKDIDTYVIEPWHWRYVGEDFAKYLLENDLTFGEFYNNNFK